MLSPIFTEITIIMILACIFAYIFKLLKLPAILSYIIVGLVIGPLGLIDINNATELKDLSKIGITLLLFILGLELKIGDLKSVGKTALFTGIGQIVFTSIFGFFISYFILGFETLTSVYLSIGLTFSSTIVIVKLLSDKKELGSLHGKIAVGFLLVQDFVAILALVILAGIGSAGSSDNLVGSLILVMIKAALLFGLVIFISKNIVPQIVHNIARSHEVLFVFSLAWALGIAALAQSEVVGLTVEMGGFLAGFALANSIESLQIVSKAKALRDFFIIIFFVILGMGLEFHNIEKIILPSILLSVFVLIGNPLIVMFIMKILGYKKHTGFMAGLAVAQISEFSLIVLEYGDSLGHLHEEDNAMAVITLVGIVTFIGSSYMILNSERLYRLIEPYLDFFEKKEVHEQHLKNKKELKDHIILIGAHRMGKQILENLEELKKKVLVIDFDPSSIDWLKSNKIQYIFGDITDSDIQEEARVSEASLIISTIPSFEDNVILIENLKLINEDIQIIVSATDTEIVEDLYKKGADFVIQPYTFVGNSIGEILEKHPGELLEKLKRKKKF